MKKIFYTGLIILGLFEILNVYFIMPMPGSQQAPTIKIAYFLYSYRWIFRIASILMILAGCFQAFNVRHKWIPVLAVIPVICIVYLNFRMTADHMFLQPESLTFKQRAETSLKDSTLVIAVASAGEAKAYPVRYIQYHHQVRDELAGKPIMVTYCNVCRTGRVFEPQVNGEPENFRLVGMDHFNAMFEDERTKSWWRQATGEAITGKLKGQFLSEVESAQLSLGKFFNLYPFGKVMEGETISKESYDTLGRFESGKSRGKLTKRDSLLWKNKSWVVGVLTSNRAKAYDWTDLVSKRVIHDVIGETPVVIIFSEDGQSFNAFVRNSPEEQFTLRNDSLISSVKRYDFTGKSADVSLKRLKSYQEFWHSWKTFHPDTEVYKP
jgi:hypothetical protein